jgi:threonine dehydratase
MSVSLTEILDAAARLEGMIYPTPMIADEKLSDEIGARTFLKAECLQRAGSFKVRGAFNRISRLSEEEKARGVIAASRGNHAQGVAMAAKLNGIRAVIVLPEFAPLTKVVATRALGPRSSYTARALTRPSHIRKSCITNTATHTFTRLTTSW